MMLAAGVCDPGTVDVVPILEDRFGFEQGMDGWVVAFHDAGATGALWSLDRQPVTGAVGSGALAFQMTATAPGQVLFVRRPFLLDPGTDYSVEVVGLVAGLDAPGAADELVVGAGSVPPGGGTLGTVSTVGTTEGTWSERTASLNVRTLADSGDLWVAVGFRSTSTGVRSQGLDDLQIRIRQR